MWPEPLIPVDLVTFTEEILNRKLDFLRNVYLDKMTKQKKSRQLVYLHFHLVGHIPSSYLSFLPMSFKSIIKKDLSFSQVHYRAKSPLFKFH